MVVQQPQRTSGRGPLSEATQHAQDGADDPEDNAVVSLRELAAELGLPFQRIAEGVARLKAAGLVEVVQKGRGGRGTSGRGTVYRLPAFSAALDRMGKRRPTRPALAAPTAADWQRAKQSAPIDGGAHSKGCAAMRTEAAPARKQSVTIHGGAPSSAEKQSVTIPASRGRSESESGLRLKESKTRAREFEALAGCEAGAREPDSLSELDPTGRQRGGEPRVLGDLLADLPARAGPGSGGGGPLN